MEFQKWNPMEEDFRNRRINSYREGVGQDLQNRDTSDIGRDGHGSAHKPVTLYIKNVPLEMDEISLQNIFEQEGKVLKVNIPVTTEEKKAKFNSKIGFVTMDNARGAQAAIENLNGFLVKGKSLAVEVKKSKEEIARQRAQHEREEEFFRFLSRDKDDDMSIAASNGTLQRGVGSEATESPSGFRSLGPHGDARSVTNDLSVTLGNTGRRVQEQGSSKRGLLPIPQTGGRTPSIMGDMPGTLGPAPTHPPFVMAPGRFVKAPAAGVPGLDLCSCCHKIASLRCTACKTVYYCNAECQRRHWPVHSKVCSYNKVTVPSVATTPVPQPNFDEMEVDIDESYLMNNQDHLQEWLKTTGPRSDTSSSSGDRTMRNLPLFSDSASVSGRSTTKPRSDPDGGRIQANTHRNYPLQQNFGPQQTRPPCQDPPQQRRTGPQGMEGGKDTFHSRRNDAQRHDSEDQKSYERPQQQPRSGGKFGVMPAREGEGRGREDGQRKPTPEDQEPPGPRTKPEPQSESFNSQLGHSKKDGPDWQQNVRGLNQSSQDNRPNHGQLRVGPQGDRPNQFQSRNGPQGDRPNQFMDRNGPQGDRPNQFQGRNGPQGEGPNEFRSRNGPQGDRPNQFQDRNGPQGDRPNQFQDRNGPQGDRPNQFQDRNGPQGNRPNQFQSRNGPQGDRPNQFQNRYGPQEDRPNQFQNRNGPQGDRPNQFQNRNGPQGDRSNQFQNRNGPQGDRPNQLRDKTDSQDKTKQFPSRNDPERSDSDRDKQFQPRNRSQQENKDQPPKNNMQSDRTNQSQSKNSSQQGSPDKSKSQGSEGQPQYSKQGSGPQQARGGPQTGQQRDGQRGGPRNDQGPGNQQQDRGNNRGRRELNGAGSGSRFNAGSSVDGNADSMDNRSVKSPSKPSPSSRQPSDRPTPQKAPSGKVSDTVSSKVGGVSQGVAVPSASESCNGLKLNIPVQVIVSFLETPQQFWVQLVDHISTYVPTLNQVLENYQGKQGDVTSAQVGQLFLCECMGELARARVVSKTGTKLHIFYVDYGNSEDTDISQLFQVPSELASVPALGVPCTLPVSPRGRSDWSTEVIQEMKGLFSEMQLCTVTLLKKRLAISEVKLIRQEDGLDAADYLREKGYSVDPSVATTPPKSVSSRRPMKKDMKFVTEQLSAGQTVEMWVVDSSGPMDIFVRILSLEKPFTDFSVKMVAEYNDLPFAPYTPVVGEMVVGRFSSDERWYRAEVLEVQADTQQACLFYVDFGNKEELPFEEIRALKADHASFPIHGFNCGIGGVSLPADRDSQEDHKAAYVSCLQKFLKQVDGMLVCTVVVESIKDGKVWIDMVSEDQPQTLSEQLAQQLEADLLPLPIQPQVVSPTLGAPTKAAAAAAVEQTTPIMEKTTPSQSQVVSPTLNDSPIAAAAIEKATPDIEKPSQPEKCEERPAKSSAKGLEKVTLRPGEELEAGIQDIESLRKFHITLKKTEDELNLLGQLLNSQEHTEACQTVSPGDLVLVEFSEDTMWYRGLVERIYDDGTTCSIFFTDYGNKENKKINTLKVVPQQFRTLPAQAITCQLAGLPLSVPEETERNFKALCLRTEVIVKVVDSHGGCYSVDVVTADGKSISSFLGLQPGEAPAELATCPALENADGRESARSPVSCPPLEGVNSTALSSQPVSPQVLAPSAEQQPTQGMSGGNQCRLTRENLSVGLDESGDMDMIVTHVVSPACFNAADKSQFMAQHEEGGLITQLAVASSSSLPLTSLPAVGELLAGLFQGEWFRCEVMEIVSSQVRVTFFDYGNEAVLGLSDLCPLPQELCYSFPLATIKCCIDGIGPVSGENWDEESISVTKSLLEDQPITVRVMSVKGEVRNVTVIQQSSDQDVGQTLVHEGKAVSLTSGQSAAQKEELMRQMQELQAKMAALGTQ